MRRSILVPAFFAVFLLVWSALSHPAFASGDKMILPDPFDAGPGTDAVLVIDVSGSMKQSDPEYLCRKAAADFIEEFGQASLSRVGLVTFSDSIRKVIPLTVLGTSEAESELAAQIQSLEYTSGDTDIGEAIQKAVSLLLEESNDARAKCILLLTDGEIDLPGKNEEEAEKESLTNALVAVEDAKKNGIVIHTVALDLSNSLDENLMNYMADSTGGCANKVTSPGSLETVFRTLSEYASNLSLRMAETESEALVEEVMTEAETEAMTEPETERQQTPMVIQTIGTINGPVELSGLLPPLCSARVRLSELFSLAPESGGFNRDSVTGDPNSAVRYTAYADDNSILTCTVEGDLLTITGRKNGTARITVIAEPGLPADALNDPDLPLSVSAIRDPASATAPEDSFSGSASLSFSADVRALIPSPWYLALIPSFLALAVILFRFVRSSERPKEGSGLLSGTLQWYVRGENEKIFGMPSQTRADLINYGRKVRLSDLVRDDLIADADLNKVSISAFGSGIRIISRSHSILLARAGGEPGSIIDMPGTGRFKVFCETARGKAVIIALYTSGAQYKTESSCEDDSDERTRLLV